jgi:hypothetical protein
VRQSGELHKLESALGATTYGCDTQQGNGLGRTVIVKSHAQLSQERFELA